MRKNLCQSIKKSLGRYIAIAVIIALGAGMFVGLRSTRNDMVATGQVYTDEYNMFDLRLLSSYGWGQEQLEQIRGLDGIQDAEGIFYMDLIVEKEDEGSDSVFRFYTIPENINRLSLRGGRMPERDDECLADGFRNGDSILGTQITVSDTNDPDSLEMLRYKTYTVVGYVGTPLYMDMNRGNTSVGNGNISNYFFVPANAIDNDYFTEIHLTVPGDYEIYTKQYDTAMSDLSDRLEPALTSLAEERLNQVREEAERQYQDGLQEYRDGLKEYQDAKKEADEKFHDAFQELLDGEDQLRSSEKKLKDGELELQIGRISLSDSRLMLVDSRKKLAQARKDANEQMTTASKSMQKTAQDISEDMVSVEGEIAAINSELAILEAEIMRLQILVDMGQTENSAELEDKKAQRDEKLTERAALEEKRSSIQQQASQIEQKLADAVVQLAMAENQFAAAEAEITAGEAQLIVYEKELDKQQTRIQEGWEELEKGKQDWNDGFREYMDARLEAKQEFDEAEAELLDADQKLQDARKAIDEMTENDLFILDRNSNMGYCSLDSSSNIVAGVSRVFPVFFLLVAALVCITTMTRMVDEERTQIGTLKALGYSDWAIISKYLIYAGSSALIGCSAGAVVGSVVFPVILWEAYKIMIFITPQITLRIDWVLCALVVLTYTAVMLFVTWYCCRKELEEVPAELIRPKSPAAGKQLIFEKWKIWGKVSFLNKVAIRNIFRYHQRLAMMLMGIGGCVALLMTGFGLRDSLMDLVDIQFDEVIQYDLEVYFQSGRTEEQQEDFRSELRAYSEDILFFSQSSADLDAGNQTKSITLIVAPEEVTGFIDFHKGKTAIDYPGKNQVLISSGMADMTGLKPGDQVTIRNMDLEKLELTVSGIYDNHVYNYAIISPETMAEQWNREPEKQMAYVRLRDGQDAYAAGALASGLSGVMNVSVNEEVAGMVSKMMEAMNLIILVVVFCAGLLAVIVLYNLTNINITERIREIATIKVLGFNAVETAMYVFKENMVLSLMGCGAGMLLGHLLLSFVISQIKIDMIWLETRLTIPSYIYSIVFTLMIGILVDLLFYFRLEKINMAEALKSVE